jgi:L-fuculose-phosphate aldolase
LVRPKRMESEKQIKKEIIAIGRRLSEKGLVCARAGNLSARLDKNNIFITATGAALGELNNSDIVKVRLQGKAGPQKNRKQPSSELPLHSLIYKTFSANIVIHCHPPLVNAYFAVFKSLKALTFETRFYLKEIPVVEKKSLTVTKPKAVICALKKNSLVVIRNHGVFSMADGFRQALYPIEILQEAVKVAAVAKLFKKRSLDKIDREIKKRLLAKKNKKNK